MVTSGYDPGPSIRDVCRVGPSGSHPHVLILYAPVRAFVPPCIRLLLDVQGFRGVASLSTDYGYERGKKGPGNHAGWGSDLGE